jgi:competence protein ComEC
MSWRRQSLVNTLAAAGIIVLALNPADLFRVGPQLSFLAVATLLWFELYLAPREPDDPLDRLIARTRPWYVHFGKWIAKFTWKLFVVSAVIWLVSLPLSMYRFHLFSPIAIFLNTLIAIPVSVAMLAGFGLIVAEWTITPLAASFAWLCDGSLWLMQELVTRGAQWRDGYWFVAGPPLWLVLVFYGGLGLLVALPRWRPPKRWCVALLLVWLALGASVPLFVRGEVPVVADARDELRCTFISTGHGSAVVLELPSGQTLLYDAGRLGSPERAARSVAAYLWSRQITRIEAVVLSHADVDHYNGMPGLVDRFRVDAVYVSPVMFETDAGAVIALKETLQRAKVPVKTIYSGDKLAAGGATKIEVLHPTKDGVIGSDNANSLVLLIEHAGRKILLTGDLESPGLDDVLAEEPIDVDIAAAPHHGSSHSSPEGFAAWCRPEHVVISGGYGFDSTAAEATFREANINVLHTARDGALSVRILRSGEFQIDRWRQNRR